MNITFYHISDAPDVLNKSLGNAIITARALAPTAQINTLNPVVVVAWDNTLGPAIINANYAYIDTFARYYWITTGVDTANRIVVSGKCDYLMSWSSQIRECPANIVRAELGKPSYVIDNKYPIDNNRFVTEGIPFPNSIENASISDQRHYILVLNKGGVSNGT